MVNGRAKGHSYERDIAARFREIYPDAKRHLEYQSQEAKGFDLDNTGPFRVQCKRGRSFAPINRIKEVQCSLTEIPLLVTKGDREKDIVCIYLDDFLDILKDVGIVYE